jgi:hypothetical protein
MKKIADPAVLQLMEKIGGSFVSSLAVAWMNADPANHARMMEAFDFIYDRYENMMREPA